jgi:hypothetical protein
LHHFQPRWTLGLVLRFSQPVVVHLAIVASWTKGVARLLIWARAYVTTVSCITRPG